MTILLRAGASIAAKHPVRSVLSAYAATTCLYGAYKEHRAIQNAEAIARRCNDTLAIGLCLPEEQEEFCWCTDLLAERSFRGTPYAELPLSMLQKSQLIAIAAARTFVMTPCMASISTLVWCEQVLDAYSSER